MMQWLGRLTGFEDLEAIHDVSLQFAAPWAADRPALVIFACIAVTALAVVFYLKWQNVGQKWGRGVVTVIRATLLALIVVILAEPVIALGTTQTQRPLLVLLFDTTDSMNIADTLTPAEREAAAEAFEFDDESVTADEEGKVTRAALLRAALTTDGGETLLDLDERFRLRAYAMDRADHVRELALGQLEGEVDAGYLADQLIAEGPVTALGSALSDLDRRHHAHLLAGVVVVSDFDQNAGPPPLPAAARLNQPIFTVGVGPREVVDLAVDMQMPLLLKKDETAAVTVNLRQSGLTGRDVRVELLARKQGGTGLPGDPLMTAARIGEPRTVTLDGARQAIDIPWQPDETGRYMLTARVEPMTEEALTENNTVSREIDVRDDSLRLLFVEHEPTWEWRFVKEVFHRDPLIGREGFRTYLQSADFKVRQTNELFLETLIRPRSEFFAYDVIFLSDVPADMLTDHFQNMLKEYVSRFGGGLVVIAGPEYGPQALAETQLAEMLPVVPDPAAPRRDRSFRMRRTQEAEQYGFMQLGGGQTPEQQSQENQKAWRNMGKLPWYQPVARPHPLATVLATHPTDRTADEQSLQPLIAVRRYGKGEVVYLGFNEMWRLRRLYNERYYRQFWGQMIYRLGLGRALGAQKRFRVETDRRSYQAGDKVRISVEAYDQDFEPLDVDRLEARVIATDAEAGEGPTATQLTVPLSRDEVIFETTVPVFTSGEHRLLVRDPETGEEVEVSFEVAPVTAERRSAVRNVALQRTLAEETTGAAIELTDWARLPELIESTGRSVTSESRFPLWNTWLFFLLGVGLMLTEWLSRKMLNLP